VSLRGAARRRLVGIALAMAALPAGGCESGDESPEVERPDLRVVPPRAAPGDWVELVVDAPADRNVDRGSTSYLEKRVRGKWRTIYLLQGDEPAGYDGGPIIGVGLGEHTRDLVTIPPVGPGTYRIRKDLAISKNEEPGPRGPARVDVHGLVEVTRR